MTPAGHLLVAGVPVVGYVLVRERGVPARSLLFAVFVGSLFPDVIDKPLAYQWSLIPTGRAFAHSLAIAIPLSIGLLVIVHRTGHAREGIAFVFAYVAHIATDFWWLLSYPADNHYQYLLWPLVPAPPSSQTPPWAGPGSIYLDLWTAFSIAVIALTGYLVGRKVHAGNRPR